MKEAESDEQNRQREMYQQMQDYISELEAECIRLRQEVQDRELISSATSVVCKQYKYSIFTFCKLCRYSELIEKLVLLLTMNTPALTFLLLLNH